MASTKQRANSMNKKILITSVVIASIGVAAMAHNGATGIVKERMDGMSAMSKAVKALTPIMRGTADYDADKVRSAADVMIKHAGEQMTSLFPEGTGGMPSSALPAVWDNWEEFSKISNELKAYAEGMKIAAGNGLAGDAVEQGDAMMGGSDDTMMGETTEDAMGGDAMGAETMITAEMFATMPVDTAFASVAQTCSACHQKFRAKEN